MSTHTIRALSADYNLSEPARAGRFAQPDGRPRCDSSLSRGIEAASLLPDGSVDVRKHTVPDHPLFLEAAGAIARGTLLRTTAGPVAVEDLMPGDALCCAGGRSEQVLWIGSTLVAGGAQPTPSLTRVMPEAFGLGRPAADVLAGPAARILHARPELMPLTGAAEVLTPLADFRDGETVIQVTPPSSVRVYHILLARHCAFDAGGLAVESFHPGLRTADILDPGLRARFLSLFPHLTSFAGFGALAWPRVSGETLARLTAA
jgi:hypothetical protein